MDWGTPASDIGLVHLYEALQDLTVWYYLCTHSLSELFGSDLAQLYCTMHYEISQVGTVYAHTA